MCLITEDRVKVFNTARQVFLYDESYKDTIRKAQPQFMMHLVTGREDDATLGELASAGVMVTYELADAKPVDVSVRIGSPLSAALRKKMCLDKPQEAFIKIPSGTLNIDTLDTITLEPGERTLCRGAQINVPPGDYVISLYRTNGDSENEESLTRYYDGYDRENGETDGKPGEIILLTPAAHRDSVRKIVSVLRHKPIIAPWRREYTVQPGEFHGKVIVAPEAVWVNMDQKAAETLNLRRGMKIQLVVGSESHYAVFLAWYDLMNEWHRPVYSSRDTAAMKGLDGKTLSAGWGYPILGKKIEALRFMRFDWHLGRGASHKIQVGDPATIYVLEDELHTPPDNIWQKRWAADRDCITGQVLVSVNDGIILNIGTDALKILEVRPGDHLKISAGNESRTIIYCGSEKRYLKEKLRPPEENKREIKRLEGELRQINLRRNDLWLQRFNMGKFRWGSIEIAMVADEYDRLSKEAEKIQQELRNLQIYRGNSNGPLGGVLIPHWDVPTIKVLACRPLYEGTKTHLQGSPGTGVLIEKG